LEVGQLEVLRLATRGRETGIYIQPTANRSRTIAPDVPATGIDSRFPLRLDRGEGQGEVSNSIHIQSTGIRSREIAIYIQEIASDIEEIGIYIMEIAADSRETGIYWSEIATYSQEITADIQEMAANIGEIRIYTRRIAAHSRGMAANSPFPLISA
jgi:hypothetical protein